MLGEFSFCVPVSHLSGNLCLQDGTAQGLGTSHGTLAGKRRHCLAYRMNSGCMRPCLRSGVWVRSRQRLGFRSSLNEYFFPTRALLSRVIIQHYTKDPGSWRAAAHCKKCPSQQDWTLKHVYFKVKIYWYSFTSLLKLMSHFEESYHLTWLQDFLSAFRKMNNKTINTRLSFPAEMNILCSAALSLMAGGIKIRAGFEGSWQDRDTRGVEGCLESRPVEVSGRRHALQHVQEQGDALPRFVSWWQ